MPPEVADEPVDNTPAVDEVDTSPASEMPDIPDSPAPEAAAPAPSPWEQVRSIPAFQGRDESEVAQAVYQALQQQQALQHQLRQYQSIVPVASEYLSNREMYERWKQSQGQAPQPAQAPQAHAEQPQDPGWWNPPKLRDAYKQYLVKDENGREVISPDAPLDAKHALVEYQQYKAEFARKFLENPEETLMPMVAKVAEQRAQDLIQSQLARRDEEAFVTQIEQENAEWLRDENGNVSREALLAQKYIEEVKQYGVQGAKSRWELSKRLVERDLLYDYYLQHSQQAAQQPAPQQLPPGEAQARQNMEFLRQQAKRNPARSSPGTADPRVPKPKMTFEERLLSQMQAEGQAS